jgi:hypothetical protein
MTPSIVGRSTSGARRTLTMVWATGRRVGRWESRGGRRKAAAGLLRAEAKAPSGRRLLRIPSDESQTPARGLRWLDVEAAALLRSLGRVLQRAPRWLVVPLRVLVLEKSCDCWSLGKNVQAPQDTQAVKTYSASSGLHRSVSATISRLTAFRALNKRRSTSDYECSSPKKIHHSLHRSSAFKHARAQNIRALTWWLRTVPLNPHLRVEGSLSGRPGPTCATIRRRQACFKLGALADRDDHQLPDRCLAIKFCIPRCVLPSHVRIMCSRVV